MRKFNFERGDRKLFFKKIASNLIRDERIETTTARAKEIRPIVERMVSMGKKQTLASFRDLLSKLPKKEAEKVYFEIAPRYKERKGGYLKITKTGDFRKRDGAVKAIIEFVK